MCGARTPRAGLGAARYRVLCRDVAQHPCRRTLAGEIWNKRKNGEVYPQWLTISRINDAEGEATHYIAIFRM